MTITKRQVVEAAFEELALGDAAGFDISPEELAFGLRRLEMLASGLLYDNGVSVGYLLADTPSAAKLTDDSGLTRQYLRPYALLLAAEIAPAKGKTLPAGTAVAASSARDTLLATVEIPDGVQPGYLPVGAGVKATPYAGPEYFEGESGAGNGGPWATSAELDAETQRATAAEEALSARVDELEPITGASLLAMHPVEGLVDETGSHTHVVSGTTDAAQGSTVLSWIKVTNEGPTTGYGRRYGYVSNGYGTGGKYDLAEATIARWERSNAAATGGTGMAQWLVAMSPRETDPGCSHRTTIAEWNVVYRGIDNGWQSRRSNTLQSAVFVQVVPEAQNFAGQADPGVPKNILAGFVFTNAPSTAETTAIGYRPRMYNCLLGEPNSVHETGYAIYWSGSDGTGGTGGGAPKAFAGLAESWQAGLRTDGATFTLDPVVLGAGQGVSWYNGSTRISRVECTSGGSLVLGANGYARGVKNTLAWGPTRRAVDGDVQRREFLLWRAVSNPSGVALTTDGESAWDDNQIVIPQSGAMRIRGNVVARSATPAVSGWDVTILARRNAADDATVLFTTITKDTSADVTDWTLSAAADDTNGAVTISISGTGNFIVNGSFTVADAV